jgi:hypothetical protein
VGGSQNNRLGDRAAKCADERKCLARLDDVEPPTFA